MISGMASECRLTCKMSLSLLLELQILRLLVQRPSKTPGIARQSHQAFTFSFLIQLYPFSSEGVLVEIISMKFSSIEHFDSERLDLTKVSGSLSDFQ